MVQDDGSNIIAAAQRAATLEGYPRICGAPGCKRARRCVGPQVRCLTEEMRSLPTRVAGRYVAAGRRMLREADTRGADARPDTKPQPVARLVPIIQALMYCIGRSADR